MHRVSSRVKVAAAVFLASSFLWAPPAIAAIRGPVSPLPVRNVNYGLYMNMDGVRTAPQQPLGASVSSFLPTPRYRASREPVALPTASSARCGGDLPPCWVMRRESGPNGDINAFNDGGCGGHNCYGKWQFDPRTGDGTGSEAEQDAEARRVWDNGRGCSHWAAC